MLPKIYYIFVMEKVVGDEGAGAKSQIHWVHEFTAVNNGGRFNMVGFYERLLDMSDRGEVPINVPHRCCDPVRDPVRELNEAHFSGDEARIRAVQAKILSAIGRLEEI